MTLIAHLHIDHQSIECQAEGMIAADIAAGSMTRYQAYLAVILIAMHVRRAMLIMVVEAMP